MFFCNIFIFFDTNIKNQIMLFYILLLLSCYVILKDIKEPKNKKKVVFIYASVLCIGLMYNFGEFVGEQLYLLGVSI